MNEDEKKDSNDFWQQLTSERPSLDYDKIDKSTRPLIKILNDKGFITAFSCSGDLYETNHDIGYFCKKGKGYISFVPMPKERERILTLIAQCVDLSYLPSTRDDPRFCIYNFNPKQFTSMMTNVEANNLFVARWQTLEKKLRELKKWDDGVFDHHGP